MHSREGRLNQQVTVVFECYNLRFNFFVKQESCFCHPTGVHQTAAVLPSALKRQILLSIEKLIS